MSEDTPSSDVAPNYAYWQQNGAYWVDEYQRRRRQDPLYGLQEIVLISAIEKAAPGRVLEYGCGVGRHLSYLNDVPGIEIYGVDQSPTMLGGLKTWAGPEWIFEHTRLIQPTGAIPFDDKFFDLSYTAEVLIHVRPEDLESRLKELIRVSRRAILHLEPPEDYILYAEAHDGCWHHDLQAAYAHLGIKTVTAGRPIDAQALVIADLGHGELDFIPGPATLAHIRKVEQWLREKSDPAVTAEAAVTTETESTMTRVGQSDYFPTQGHHASEVVTIGPVERSLGAPYGPVPHAFRTIPVWLESTRDPATEEELAEARRIRQPFLIEGYQEPYLDDITRAFRNLKGLKTYIEIGTFDRGNLAYVSNLLADDALLIGVDVQIEQRLDDLLRDTLKPGQSYVSIAGDSRLPGTVDQVVAALSGRPADAVFIDGDHTAYGAMCDYVNYGSLVRSGGLVLFHDAVWEGNAQYKGVAHALREIDRLEPIYLIPGFGPCYRFMPTLFRDQQWGVVACNRKD